MPAKISHQSELIEKCKKDIAFYIENSREYDKEERKVLRTRLFEAVKSNLLTREETVFCMYQGFDIVLPSNMTTEKPFVWLQKNGRYYVELGDTEIGGLIRIDNYLGALPNHLLELENNYKNLCERHEAVKLELTKKENYTDNIEEIKRKLEKIDKKLGVGKK